MNAIRTLYLKIVMPFVLVVAISSSCLAQKTYLTIFTSGAKEKQVTYPPGTPFELRDSTNKVILTDSSAMAAYKIIKPYTLVIYPKWKSETDVFTLTEGSLTINEAPYVFNNKKKRETFRSKGVIVEKTLSDSKKLKDMKNLTLEFSNGILFQYTDGQVEAFLNEESLRIEDKYLIYSNLGVAKVSFNPNNGVLYWIFEPIENEK